MFTGIVKGVFPVLKVLKLDGLHRLWVSLPPEMQSGLETGASIAVNGCCLTVTGFDDRSVSFDVMQETLRVTNLGKLEQGSLVNIERAARLGDEIGGHSLSGHIHDTVLVDEVVKEENNVTVYFRLSDRWQDYLLPKGYVSLNGCSLTIGDQVKEERFCVHLIPETLHLTTFDSVQKGDRINLEVDSQTQAIVDTVKKYLQQNL